MPFTLIRLTSPSISDCPFSRAFEHSCSCNTTFLIWVSTQGMGTNRIVQQLRLPAAKAVASLCTCTGSSQLSHSAVGNVSGNRCESDCRSKGWSSIPARSHTFVEIDHEIISTVILLPSA